MDCKVRIKITTVIDKEYDCYIELKTLSERKINDLDVSKYLNERSFIKDYEGRLISCKQIESFVYEILEQ